jgi:hypothetical protein
MEKKSIRKLGKYEFNVVENKIIKSIASETFVHSEKQKTLYDAFFIALDEVLKRGCNVDLSVLKFTAPTHTKELRNARLGDQKAVVKCLRKNEPVHLVRNQTKQKYKKVKQDYDTSKNNASINEKNDETTPSCS